MATNPHIYVSSVVGTNTGASDTSKATQQTGNITSMTASDVYDNLGSAVAGATPGDGDTIYVCDNHAASYDNGIGPNFNSGGLQNAAGLRIISVDNTSINTYKAGASDILSDTSDDFQFDGNGFVAGLTLSTGDNVITNQREANWTFQDCVIAANNSSDYCVRTGNDHSKFRFIGCTFKTLNVNNAALCEIRNGGFLLFRNCTIDTSTTYSFVNFCNAVNNGGAVARLESCNLTGITGTLLTSLTTASGPCELYLRDCVLDPSMTSFHGTLYSPMQRLDIANSDQTSTDDLHRFYIADGAGSCYNNDAVYVTANQPFFEGSDKSSIQVETSSICSQWLPFEFTFPARYVNFGDTGVSDTVSINIVTDFTLYDTDINFTLMYPDGTTNVISNILSSAPTTSGETGMIPLNPTSTELNTTGALAAGDWTGEPTTPTPKFYKVNLDTSGDVGDAYFAKIKCEVYKSGLDGTAGNKLYIDPILAVGT